MAKKNNNIPPDMKLTKVVKEFLDEQGWTDDIVINEKEKSSVVSTHVTIKGTAVRMYIEAEEGAECISVFLYTPISIPKARRTEICLLLSHINMSMGLGRLATSVYPNEEAPIQYRVKYDVEGGQLGVKMLGTMAGAGVQAFEFWIDVINQVALTKTTAIEALKEFIEKPESDE